MNETGCQINSAFNSLLTKMLLISQPQLLLQQKQSLQRDEMTASTSEKTTTITSTETSTITSRVPKVLSIWFRNERIPTTIFVTMTQVITELVTTTSVIGVEPTDLAHDVQKRQAAEVTPLDSSFPERNEDLIEDSFRTDDTILYDESIMRILAHQSVKDAFSNLITAVQLVTDKVKRNTNL